MVLIITAAALVGVYREDIFGNGIDNINENTYGEVNPDTWVAVDGLGRTLPVYEETGEKNKEKFVGLFYWTWHYQHSQNRPARNVTEMLLQDPDAVRDYDNPVWTDTEDGCPYYWNEPLFGYYTNIDEYVVRKHAEEVIVEKSTGGWNFQKTGTGKYNVDKNVMYIEIPREALGFDDEEEIKFNFKLSDNMQTDGDIMDFYQNGDVASGGRFMFAF